MATILLLLMFYLGVGRDLDRCRKNASKEIYMHVHIVYIFS